MKPFGFDRTYSKCRVISAGFGRKVKVAVFVKSRKKDRKHFVETTDLTAAKDFK